MMIAGSALVGGHATAVRPDPAPAATFDALLACHSIADPQQRLACFDGNAAQLQDAQAKHDIVVVDREQMRRTRKSLFGFTLPSLDLFGDHAGKAPKPSGGGDDDVKEITEPVKSAHQDGMGNWTVVLASGATWQQTEGMIALAPKPGTDVTIKRGALGSYFMRVGSQPGVKARRAS
ncbi:MAG: hypothetical protein JWO65_1121 [Sphingomonas bacterium]|jgi:hypothetical protein|nr:hypothetical protein [Sphingomonas bacterium]